MIDTIIKEQNKHFNPDSSFLMLYETDKEATKHHFDLIIYEPETYGNYITIISSEEEMSYQTFKEKLKAKGFEIKDRRKPLKIEGETRDAFYSLCNQNAFYIGYGDSGKLNQFFSQMRVKQIQERIIVKQVKGEFVLYVGNRAFNHDTSFENLLKKTHCKLTSAQFTKFKYGAFNYFVVPERVNDFFSEFYNFTDQMHYQGVESIEVKI